MHCDNAGESMHFECACEQEGMGIEFEHTAPGTPPINGHVEWNFSTLLNRVNAMLNGGKFSSF